MWRESNDTMQPPPPSGTCPWPMPCADRHGARRSSRSSCICRLGAVLGGLIVRRPPHQPAASTSTVSSSSSSSSSTSRPATAEAAAAGGGAFGAAWTSGTKLPAFSLGLHGRTALITGASKGIGAAVARRFAAEGVSPLHLVSRTAGDLQQLQAELLRDYPEQAVVAHAVDLAAPGAVTALWAELDASAGSPIDILVNNAGAIPAGDLLQIDEERWRSSWELKVFGYINMARKAYHRLKKDPGDVTGGPAGVIVNVIGAAGIRPSASYIAGATANAGLIAFTESLGAESIADHVRVVGVSPGATLTSRLATLVEQGIGDVGLTEGPYAAATSDEIADSVAFLASSRASHVSGTVLTVDNGRTKRAQ